MKRVTKKTTTPQGLTHVEAFIAQHELNGLKEIQAGLVERISSLEALLKGVSPAAVKPSDFSSSVRTAPAAPAETPKPAGTKRTMSAAARKKIAEAQRRRWARVHAADGGTAKQTKKRGA